MTHTTIPTAELEVFKKLPRVKVVFDVGARADVSYLALKPELTLHAFEPNPAFFKELEEEVRAIGGGHTVYLNMYGLGDIVGKYKYLPAIQSFEGGEASPAKGPAPQEDGFEINTLDWYTKTYDIPKIDFLKIDTEGFDYRVLLGGKNTLKNVRFIQYEHWDDLKQFHKLLGKDFDMEYTGYRNVLCLNKKLVPKATRKRIIKFIRDNEFGKLR